MAEVRENPGADEDFHEETPEEFAAQPDREFTKVPAPGADGSPDADQPEDATAKRANGGEPGDPDEAATGEK